MPRSSLEELAARWVPGDGPVDVRPLSSGLINESFRVARGGRMYSLRVQAPDSGDLGLDRGWECRVLEVAAAAGLAPAILCCDSQAGILVAEWVDGRIWTAREIRQPRTVDAMAQLLRRVHSLPPPECPRAMDAAAWIAHYDGALRRRGSGPAPPLADLRPAAAAHLAALAALRPATPVLCHSDLHRFNLLTNARTVLLDWEYAHLAEPFWDVVGWAANNDWARAQTLRWAASYLGRPPDTDERLRLEVLGWLYDYVCLLWSEVYSTRRPGEVGREVSARAARLAARLRRPLRRPPRSRAVQVPAH